MAIEDRMTWLAFVGVLILAAWGCAAPAEAAATPYSWQQTHAELTPEGDLVWSPHPFVFEPGDSVRYIDFEAGDDSRDGLSRETAWKHHPWDPEAAGRAAAAGGAHTYVFKRGVIYRGALRADESGEPDDPIRLTSDPDWGQGHALITGGERITGWQRLSAAEAPDGMPEPEQVWYADIGTDYAPRAMWMVRDGEITRVHLAREPDWEVSNPDDVKSEWYVWRHSEREQTGTEENPRTRVWGFDPDRLTAADPEAYVGGTVWSEYAGVMGQPYPSLIEAYDPQRHAIRFGGPWGDAARYAPTIHSRYFIENLPELLDSAGEYLYAGEGPHAGRLYVRLAEGLDPNEVDLEAARRIALIDIRDQSHIHVSGLAFRFQNVAHWFDRWWQIADQDPSCVRAIGDCRDIRVSNCRFEHVMQAVWMQTADAEDVMDDLAVTDNEIVHCDYGPIWMLRGDGEMMRVEVLRNRLYRVGIRPMRSEHGHAVQVNFASLAEVAGNVLDRCWGAGLFIFGGKGSGRGGVRPLSRILMHHNKVTDPLLNANDWGGIESWQGGPTYVYNNISGNPGGYWHRVHVRPTPPEQRTHTTARFGFAYYLDGAFKQYVFNNIAWGKSNDLTSPLCNTAGLQEIIGFMNGVFNNTFYKFAAGSRRQAPQAGRNRYLGNLWMDISEMYFRHDNPRDAAPEPNAADAAVAEETDVPYAYETLAYGQNVYRGEPRHFGVFEHTGWTYDTLEDFGRGLQRRGALISSAGVEADDSPVRDAEAHDFRPLAGSELIDRGVKFFVPWGLYAVVGEWHFYQHPGRPERVPGEHWFMTDEYEGRGMYRFIPRHDLAARGVGADSYVEGPLEDWTRGALSFNGVDQHCVLSDADLKSDYQWGGGENVRTYPGAERRTPDMDTNNFLIEVYFRTAPGHTGGTLVSKMDEAGYALTIGEQGGVVLSIGTREEGRTTSIGTRGGVNDGGWHHVIAEIDRSAGAANLYLDGKLAVEGGVGIQPDASLSNQADFLVGRGPEGDYFAGAIDFLRVSRGTLADARTTIEELYEWQFNGPFLRDFFGNDPVGGRDAGAIEHVGQ